LGLSGEPREPYLTFLRAPVQDSQVEAGELNRDPGQFSGYGRLGRLESTLDLTFVSDRSIGAGSNRRLPGEERHIKYKTCIYLLEWS
jgi:hypothetical protein